MPKVEIYSRTVCPYCTNAKRLLASKGQEWEEINLDEQPEKVEEMLERSGGRMTVPQVFIDGRLMAASTGYSLSSGPGSSTRCWQPRKLA